jgi:hypothetical protein
MSTSTSFPTDLAANLTPEIGPQPFYYSDFGMDQRGSPSDVDTEVGTWLSERPEDSTHYKYFSLNSGSFGPLTYCIVWTCWDHRRKIAIISFTLSLKHLQAVRDACKLTSTISTQTVPQHPFTARLRNTRICQRTNRHLRSLRLMHVFLVTAFCSSLTACHSPYLPPYRPIRSHRY